MVYSDGTLYNVTDTQVITSGGSPSGTINVTAVDAGADGTREVADTLAFVSAPAEKLTRQALSRRSSPAEPTKDAGRLGAAHRRPPARSPCVGQPRGLAIVGARLHGDGHRRRLRLPLLSRPSRTPARAPSTRRAPSR